MEKTTKEVRVLVSQSLYERFQEYCNDEYKTMTQALRHLMTRAIKDNDMYKSNLIKKEKNI